MHVADMTVSGVSFTADLSGALYWADERLLVVSDLHLEKGSSFAMRGVLLPPHDTTETLARLDAVIARYQPRVVIGIPTAGQAVDGHDHLVGHCVNTLPLLFEPDLERPAALAIEQAQTTLLDALEHQRLTFGTLLRKLRIGRDPSRLPLVSVMFNIDQALDHQDSAFPGLQLEWLPHQQ